MIQLLSIFMFKDYVEILFFSTLIYSLSRWLLYDYTKKLIPYLYGYLTLFIFAHYYECTTITFFLLLTIPGAIGTFILMHQETLQKNLIGLKNISSPIKAHSDWTESLMQTVLYQINRKKDMLCIIEKTDDLSSFIAPLFALETPLSSDFLTILCDSPSYNHTSMLWITHNGIMKGINSTWNTQAATTHSQSHEITRLYTQTNDALFFHAHALTNQATVIINGSIEKNYSMFQLHQLIHKHRTSNISLKKGIHYERQASNNFQKPAA